MSVVKSAVINKGPVGPGLLVMWFSTVWVYEFRIHTPCTRFVQAELLSEFQFSIFMRQFRDRSDVVSAVCRRCHAYQFANGVFFRCFLGRSQLLCLWLAMETVIQPNKWLV